MSDREDKLETALHKVSQWAQAYPLEVFREVDLNKARAALEGAGISMDALHGTWARHIVTGIGTIAADALKD